MDHDQQLLEVFVRLQSFYILITIHDVEDYNILELQALAHRLEGQLALEDLHSKINQELMNRSDFNVDEKQRKKKEKKQALLKQKNKKTEQEYSKVLSELDTMDNSNSLELKDEITKYEVQHVINGIIYDGKMFVQVDVKTKKDKQIVKLSFFVSGETKKSTIKKDSLNKLKVVLKNNLEPISLFIEGRSQLFQIVEEGENVLGLDFLKENKIFTTCNYREDCVKCKMTFTS